MPIAAPCPRFSFVPLGLFAQALGSCDPIMTSGGDTFESSKRAQEDALLLRRMAAGEREALAALYDRFSRPLFSTARHILRDDAEAQDVVHDVFISLWENAASFDHRRGGAFAWAVTLTRNRSIDRLRVRSNRARLLGASVPDDLGLGEDSSPLSGGESADLGERAKAVRTALAALSPEQRAALEMAFFSGLTQKEISEKLSEPIGTVKARIRRGLLKLRDVLAGRL